MRGLLTLAATFVLAPAVADVAPPPASQHLIYDILRNGSPIGRNIIDIDKKGGVTSVNMTSDVSVKILFVNAYTYHYTGSETWTNDQLTAFTSQTNDNGTTHKVTVRPSGDRLDLEADGKHSTIPKTVGLDDFWTPQLLSKPSVLDTSDGHQMTFTVQDLGMEKIDHRGTQRAAHHFKLTGGIKRDLWFDAGTVVRFQLTGSDGSMIVSELR